jgi:hypothetical protein
VTLLLGSKERFALEIGERAEGLRRVDAWMAGQWLTCDDNLAYVPQLRWCLQRDRVRLESAEVPPSPFPGLSPSAVHRQLLAGDDGLREQWCFLERGPTTDNVLAHVFRESGYLVITVEFRRDEHLQRCPEHTGAVFASEITAEELAGILQNAAAALGCDPAPQQEPRSADLPASNSRRC